MYKKVVKVVDLSTLNVDETVYVQFKNNTAWNSQYIKSIEEEGYSQDYISYENNDLISTKFISVFWLMSLKIAYDNYINEDSNIVPSGISIQVINPEISVKLRTNQKWLVPITYIYKCEVCKNLFDKDCVCIK